MPEPYKLEQEVGLKAVRLAATICHSVQSKITPDVLKKNDRSPVTTADFASQAAICRMIREAFPDDPIIAEEDASELRSPEQAIFIGRIQHELTQVGHHADPETICDWIDYGNADRFSDRYWTLDPIDGTKGFLRKQQYAVSLALIEEGEICLGILGCPNLPLAGLSESLHGSLLYAVKGGGSFQTQLFGEDHDVDEIEVSVVSHFEHIRLCESVESGHSSHDSSREIATRLGVTTDPVRLDSQAKYAVVARGDADIYLRLPTSKDYAEKIWDHAGGVLVVQEAGGTVTDVDGKPLDFTRGKTLLGNRGVVVSNGPVHAEVVEVVRQVLGE